MTVSWSYAKKIFSLCIVTTLAFVSGWRDVGFDRFEYIKMYHLSVSADTLEEKLYFAKDLSFLLLSELVHIINDEPKLAFFFICLLSVVTKGLAISKISKKQLLIYLVLYTLFLAPGLEFAAMRSGLAIGFFLLALAYSENLSMYLVLSLFSVMSHTSMLPIVVLALPIIRRFIDNYKISYLIIAIFTSGMGKNLIILAGQGRNYGDNLGTLYAYLLPLITLVIAILVFFQSYNDKYVPRYETIKQYTTIIRPIVFCLIAIAFGITSEVVTAATRYLEIAWCLLLLSALISYRRSYLTLIGLVVLMLFLTYFNIKRFTWLAIYSPESIEMGAVIME